MVRSRLVVFQVITEFGDVAPAQSAAVLAKYLDRSKFDVTAVSLRAQPGGPSRTIVDLERVGIRHLSIGMRGPVDLTGMCRLYRLVRREEPDVLHSHSVPADLWCGIVGRLTGVPLIVNTVRNHDAHVFRSERTFVAGEFAVGVSRCATAVADKVIAVSEGVAAYLRRDQHVPASKIHVIRNAFDFERLAVGTMQPDDVRARLGWRPDDLVVGTLAIMRPRKGLVYLIQAAAQVLSMYPRARFFIAGDGKERAALDAEIRRLGIAERFHLLGHRDDPLALLRASDVFVLPSLFEGLPRSLLEAMALERPVIVTDIGGSREVVRDGVSGLVVPPRDVSSLAAAIGKLLMCPQLRRELGAEARRVVVEQFDPRRAALAHETVYSQSVKTNRVTDKRALETVIQA